MDARTRRRMKRSVQRQERVLQHLLKRAAMTFDRAQLERMTREYMLKVQGLVEADTRMPQQARGDQPTGASE